MNEPTAQPELTPKERIEAWAQDNAITLESEFVPFSKSRNAKEKHPSLNWKVTLQRNGHAILTTDYSAGMGHCPSYKSGFHATEEAIAWEVEHGTKYRDITPILPDLADVLYSLALDASVLDAGSFEEWAEEFGYDTDSRAAEGLYRACLDIALKLRNGLGEAKLAELQEVTREY